LWNTRECLEQRRPNCWQNDGAFDVTHALTTKMKHKEQKLLHVFH